MNCGKNLMRNTLKPLRVRIRDETDLILAQRLVQLCPCGPWKVPPNLSGRHYAAFNQLDPADTGFWNQADQYFDMEAYNDYIIGESWMANTDWPWNNIKIYRSDTTDYRWRFCLIDQELAIAAKWLDRLLFRPYPLT